MEKETKSEIEFDPDNLTLSKKEIMEFVDAILYRWKKNYLANAKYITGLELMRFGLLMLINVSSPKIWSEILNGFNDLVYENAMARARNEHAGWIAI